MKKLLCLLVLVLASSSCNIIQLFLDGKTNVPNEFFDGASAELHLNFPQQKRTHYVDDEQAIRTININYSGGSLTCSEDGGANFTPCNSPYTWEITNYNTVHVIKLTSGKGEMIESFTPSTKFPGLTFLTCTQNVTSNETAAAFISRAPGANGVVCINDGVTINNAGADGSIDLGATDITIIAREGHNVNFTSSQGIEVFNDGSRNNSNYIGFSISGTVNSQKGFSITGANVDVEDVSINLSGNTSQGMNISTNSINLKGLNITTGDLGSSYSLYINNSNVNIDDSTLEAGYQPIYFWKNDENAYNVNLLNTTIRGLKTNPGTGISPGVISIYNNNGTNNVNINFTDSTIESSGGPAILYSGNAAPGITNINLTNTKIKRLNSSNNDGPAIYCEPNSVANTLTVDADSLVCNESANTNSKFTSILTDNGAQMSFDPTVMNAHTSNSDINICL